MIPILLIVDDEPAGREALESVLTNQGYALEFAANGHEALAKATQISPDLILLDVMMPGMDGYEVCQHLRADLRTAEMPVVMVTALDDRDSLLQGIEAGADDFITKPIDRAELRARVRTITRLNRYRRLQEERAKLERQLERLTTLRTIDLAITRSLDLQDILKILLDQTMAQLKVDAAAILLYDADHHLMVYAALAGFRSDIRPPVVARRALIEDLGTDMIQAPDLAGSPDGCCCDDVMQAEGFRAYFGLPLTARGQLKGLLEVYQRRPFDPEPEWMYFMETLGEQAAIAIDNTQMLESLQRSNSGLVQAYDATLEGWSRALDLRDHDTEGHTQRVTEMTVKLARACGIGEPEMIHIRRGALLHDIGKLGIPDRILHKAGPLTEEEWEIMRKHPVHAYELLRPIAYLQPALDIPLYHHEKWDGSGYPFGYKGVEIPLAARIFAVVDVWDALLSDRPYRAGLPESQVLEYIRSQCGRHFDPEAVEKFFEVV